MNRRIMSAFAAWALLAVLVESAHAHGSYHDLLAAVDKELAAHPDDSTLLRRRAALHVDHEDWKAAMVDLERAERLGAAPADLDLPRGRALLLGGFPEQAETALASHLAAHGNDFTARAIHARALIALGRHDAGLDDYRKALRLTTEPTEDLLLEAAAAFAAHDALDEAVEVLRQAVARPDCTPALLTQSLEYELQARHFDDALARVDALQQTPPRPEPWMARRARILAQAGRAADAAAAWTRLRAHLESLPSLERGTPLLDGLLAEARRALGTAVPVQVVAPPAPFSSPLPPQAPAPISSKNP